MKKSLLWKFLNSLWIAVAFVPLLNWTAFLFIGKKANKRKWKIWSLPYALCTVQLFLFTGNSKGNNTPIMNISVAIFVLSYLYGIIHAFAARKEYLLSLEVMGNTTTENLREKIETEYSQSEDKKSSSRIVSEEDASLPKEVKDKVGYINSIINNIYDLIETVKAKAKDREKYLIVERFMNEVVEFEDALPQISAYYKKGLSFIYKQKCIDAEIVEIQTKLASSGGTAREIYQKTLNEKHATVHEIENIKAYLDECESRLHYNFSNLQKIDAVIEASDLGDALGNEDAKDLNTYLETFSEGLKGTIKSMRI